MWASGDSCALGLSASIGPAEILVDWVYLLPSGPLEIPVDWVYLPQVEQWRLLWTGFICFLVGQWRFLWTGFICLKWNSGDSCGLGLSAS